MNILLNFNQFIKNTAKKSGFSLCGVIPTSVVDIENQEFLKKWVFAKRNGDMRWFDRNEDIRFNPSLIVDDAKTIIVFAYSYNPIKLNKSYNIASYAQSTDYHFVLKDKLNAIIEEIKATYGDGISARAFTDSAPIMERYWAKKAGLGWIGKSGMIINKEEGSFTLLSEIIIDRESDIYDQESTFNGCGKCRICIDSCPTSAICEDKSIDSKRCLSYLTIEHRGDFTPTQLELVKSSTSGNKWLYGCDECLMCCPWNSVKVKQMKNSSILFTRGEDIENMSNSEFKILFKGTPLIRTGIKYIKRNSTLN